MLFCKVNNGSVGVEKAMIAAPEADWVLNKYLI
jgi:hypothetical protein